MTAARQYFSENEDEALSKVVALEGGSSPPDIPKVDAGAPPSLSASAAAPRPSGLQGDVAVGDLDVVGLAAGQGRTLGGHHPDPLGEPWRARDQPAGEARPLPGPDRERRLAPADEPHPELVAGAGPDPEPSSA